MVSKSLKSAPIVLAELPRVKDCDFVFSDASRFTAHGSVPDRCLGHAIGGVRGVYDRHQYIEEMRHAFEALANQIKRIVHPVRGQLTFARNIRRRKRGSVSKMKF